MGSKLYAKDPGSAETRQPEKNLDMVKRKYKQGEKEERKVIIKSVCEKKL